MGQKPDLKLVKYDINKHLPKNLGEQVNDLIFAVYVLGVGTEKGHDVTILNLIKTLFKLKLDFAKSGIDFLATDFYPYRYGPFNKEVYKYIDILSNGGFVAQGEKYKLSLKAKALEIIDNLRGYLKKEYGELADLLENLTAEYVKKYSSSTKAIADTHKINVLKQDGSITTVDKLAKEATKLGSLREEYCLEPNYELSKNIRVSNALVNLFLEREDPADEDSKSALVSLERILSNAQPK